MKAKTSEPVIDLDKQLKRLVKKSVEDSSASNEAWSNIVKAIQMDQSATRTARDAKPALSLSE
jgi:hypothetical protein